MNRHSSTFGASVALTLVIALACSQSSRTEGTGKAAHTDADASHDAGAMRGARGDGDASAQGRRDTSRGPDAADLRGSRGDAGNGAGRGGSDASAVDAASDGSGTGGSGGATVDSGNSSGGTVDASDATVSAGGHGGTVDASDATVSAGGQGGTLDSGGVATCPNDEPPTGTCSGYSICHFSNGTSSGSCYCNGPSGSGAAYNQYPSGWACSLECPSHEPVTDSGCFHFGLGGFGGSTDVVCPYGSDLCSCDAASKWGCG